MNRRLLIQAIFITLAALTTAAVVQELSKPKELRRWHGKVLGFIPYDFRLPTLKGSRSLTGTLMKGTFSHPGFSALAGQSIFMPCLRIWD